jgi:hypothetical protein
MTFAVPKKQDESSSTALMVIRAGTKEPRRMVLVLDEYNPNAFGFRQNLKVRPNELFFKPETEKEHVIEWLNTNQRPIFTSFVDAAHSCVVRQQNESGDFVPVSGIVYGSEEEKILIAGHEAAERAKKTFGRVDDNLRRTIIDAKRKPSILQSVWNTLRGEPKPAQIAAFKETLAIAAPRKKKFQ